MTRRAFGATAWFMVGVLMLVGLPAAADVEPNDARERAERIQPGTHAGHVGADEDGVDWYGFAVRGGDIVHVAMALVEGGADVELHLLNHEGGGLDTVRPEGDAEVTVITPVELGDRTWYLQVTDEGPYQFTLEVGAQDDAGQGRDAPRERDQALAIEPGVTEGLLGDDDEFDTCSFAVHGGDIVRVGIADIVGGADVELHLLNQEGGGLGTVRPEGESEITWLTPAEPGEQTWYLSAYGEGPYRFTLQVVPQDDAGQGTDAPEPRHRALQVRPGEIRGSVGDDDEWDCYAFGVKPGQTVEVTLTADFARFDREMNWVEAAVRDGEGSGKGGLRSAGAHQPDTFREGPLEIEAPERWTVTVGTEGDYVIDLSIIGAEGAEMQRVEQVSAIDWEVLTPVGDQQVQIEPEEETGQQVEGPATERVEHVEHGQQAEQPIDVEDETPVEDMAPVEGPLYVRVLLNSVYCVSESDVDRATDSDEPYFIVTGYATHLDPAAWSTGEPKVFGDVDSHENRVFEEAQRVVFEGEVPEGSRLGFTVLAMESDDWPADTRRRLAERVAEETALAVTGSAEAAIAGDLGGQSMWEQPEAVGWDPVTRLASWLFDNVTELINWMVGGDDDRVAGAGVDLAYEQLAAWRTQGICRDMPTVVLDGGDEGHYGIRWHIEFAPDLTRTFDARFTHWDELAIGNLTGGPEDEILTACDDDASGDNGTFRLYGGDGQLVGSFDAFFTRHDRVAVGDVMGTGYDQVVVASDDHDGMVNIYTADGQQLYSFPTSFRHFYGLAVGNVVGDARDEILIARWRDDTVLVLDGHGEELAGFKLGWDFRGTRCTDDSTRHDAFLVGDVLGDDREEIVMIDNADGRESQVLIYDTEQWADLDVDGPGGVAGGFAVGEDFLPHQPLAAIEVFFTHRDAAALGDIDGDGTPELLLAADRHTGGPGCFIDVYDLPDASKSGIRSWPILDKCDAFAAGDVLGAGADQLILVSQDDRIYVSR